jgi:hypothetical protein
MSSKIREALSKASIALSWATHHHLTEDDAKECLAIVDAALAEPVRNCDVGTAEEQEQRFIALCNKQHDDCFMCPVQNNIKAQCDCKFVWSQMPYEKEGER